MTDTSHPPILVVDDNADNAHIIRDYLEARGYPITVAYNGDDALKARRSKAGARSPRCDDAGTRRLAGLSPDETAPNARPERAGRHGHCARRLGEQRQALQTEGRRFCREAIRLSAGGDCRAQHEADCPSAASAPASTRPAERGLPPASARLAHAFADSSATSTAFGRRQDRGEIVILYFNDRYSSRRGLRMGKARQRAQTTGEGCAL